MIGDLVVGGKGYTREAVMDEVPEKRPPRVRNQGREIAYKPSTISWLEQVEKGAEKIACVRRRRVTERMRSKTTLRRRKKIERKTAAADAAIQAVRGGG